MLSPRLKFLSSLAKDPQVIWDIGCDHGLLGLSFCSNQGVEEIHLVDPSYDVILNLIKSVDSDIPSPKIFLEHKKGQEINVSKSFKNNYFIAGMGGKEIQQILVSLVPKISPIDEVIISPHRNFLALREYLAESPFRLMSEAVILDSGHFYQILKLTLRPDYPSVTRYGDSLWQNEVGVAYRDYLIKHYKHHRDQLSSDFVKFLQKLVV